MIRLNPNPFYKYLYRTAAKTLCPSDRRLITLNGSDTARVAAATLFKRRILAAPVFDENNQCLGAVDILSMLQLQNKAIEEGESTDPAHVWNTFKDLTCKEVCIE